MPIFPIFSFIFSNQTDIDNHQISGLPVSVEKQVASFQCKDIVNADQGLLSQVGQSQDPGECAITQGSTGHHCPVRKSGKFSKSGLTKNRTFSFPDAGLLSLEKMEKKNPKKIQKKNFKIFFQNFFQDFFFVYLFGLGFFDTKFVFRDLIL